MKLDTTERIGIEVKVATDASGVLPNNVTVAGGGADRVPTSVSDPLTASAQEAAFGLSGWNVWFSNADGTLDTQAGSHPYEATFALGFNESETKTSGVLAGGGTRNIDAVLPPGFFGDPNAVPQCTRAHSSMVGPVRCKHRSALTP